MIWIKAAGNLLLSSALSFLSFFVFLQSRSRFKKLWLLPEDQTKQLWEDLNRKLQETEHTCTRAHIPVQFLKLLVQQVEGGLDHFHGLISYRAEVSVREHLQEETSDCLQLCLNLTHKPGVCSTCTLAAAVLSWLDGASSLRS